MWAYEFFYLTGTRYSSWQVPQPGTRPGQHPRTGRGGGRRQGWSSTPAFQGQRRVSALALQVRVRGRCPLRGTRRGQAQAPGPSRRSRGDHRVPQPEGCRSREDQAAPCHRGRGSAARGWPCHRHCQRCREETEGIRQDYQRMEAQGWRPCCRAWCQPEGVPQLLHWAVPS